MLAETELYDPGTGTWSYAGSMASSRVKHSSVLLLSGKVLILGGRNRDSVTESAALYTP
jgi:hypothetical protein